ncbi:MAG: IS4 family transposase [Pseudomonadota bacterium]
MKTPFFPGLSKSTIGGIRRTVQARLAAEADSFERHTLLDLSRLFKPWIDRHLLEPTNAGENSRRRVFSLNNTFWTFLSQVLLPDASCREVVKKVQAWSLAKGLKEPSSYTGAYCQARRRLPLEVLEKMFTHIRDRMEVRHSEERWFGRSVKVVDATGVSMPDTPSNQKVWPQSRGQKAGCGFPVAKIVGLFGLGNGGLLDWAEGNQHTHEVSLFRRLWHLLSRGDILLADRGYCSFATLAGLAELGVDSVMRLHIRRPVDFRKGKKLGPKDRLIQWSRPVQRSTGWGKREWNRLPRTFAVRIVRYTIDTPGYRTREVDLVTTLTDPVQYPAEKLAELYFKRWAVELFFRDMKTTLGMDVLRCKSPELIRKEIVMHSIAYNLIRALMHDAAKLYDQAISRISFQGALSQVRQWSDLMRNHLRKAGVKIHDVFLRRLVDDPNPDRPDRVEPRAKKRRPKNYQLLNKPRHEMEITGHRNRPERKYRK